LEIGPSVGSCGTAAYRKEPVFVSDVASDPLWANFRDLALRHDLRACWSVPIISRAQGVLGTFALYHRESRSPTEEEKEAIYLMTRIATLALEHQRSKELRQLLVDELTHRVKNLFTVVISLAARSLRGRTDEAAYKAFENRLRAMADTQSLLTQSNWSSVDFRELVTRIAVAPFCGPGDRFRLEGPSVPVPAQFTLPLALSLHELSTNASKYGALASETGHVDIRWCLGRNGSTGRELHMSWIESGGPPIEVPGEPGFGSRMIKNAFAAGDVTLDYRKHGLVCEIKLPLKPPYTTSLSDHPD
jgi:two-component sensor histidine kinase